MFAASLGMVLGLWLAPAPADEPAAQLCDLAVHSDELEYERFEAVASVRLAGLRLRLATQEGDASCRGQLHGYVELRLQAPGRWELSLIRSDGRAWYRSVDADAEEAPRVLASLLANLLAAIADASVEADARDVSLPPELIEASEVNETDDPLAPTEISEPTPEPNAPAPADDTNERPAAAAPRGEILLELGPRAAGSMLIGLAPGPGLRGVGGGLALDLRLPDGLAFGLDLRALTATAMEVSLTRVRVALGLGFVSRSDVGGAGFELPVLISGIVEPWFVRRAGAGIPFAQPPMIGGGIRVAPGLLIGGERLRVRVGLALGLEIAVEAAAGALTPAFAFTPTSEPILRAGGVELSAGLELGVWIPVRARAGSDR